MIIKQDFGEISGGGIPDVIDVYSDYIASSGKSITYTIPTDAKSVLVTQVWGRGTDGVMCAVDVYENNSVENQYNDGNQAHYCPVTYSNGVLTATKNNTSSTSTYVNFVAF